MITLWRPVDEDGSQVECRSFEGRLLRVVYDTCGSRCYGDIIEHTDRTDRVSSISMDVGADAYTVVDLMQQVLTRIAEWQDDFDKRGL